MRSQEAGIENREPFFRARKTGNGIAVSGSPACTFGHPVVGSSGESSDGFFARWSWDGESLRITGDRYGFHPLYYCSRPDEICVSRSIPRLLLEGAPADLDEDALAVFLRLGFFIGEDTPFRMIRALPPGADIEWHDGHLRARRSVPVARARTLSRDDAIDGYIDLFRAAIRRHAPRPDDFVVPLSGGRDSRHILLELCEAGHRPKTCITVRHYPPRSNEDGRIAAMVAETLGVPHVILDQPRSRVRAEIRKNLLTGFCSDEGAWLLPVGDYLGESSFQVYDGIGGDVLSGGLFLEERWLAHFESGRFEILARALMSPRDSALAYTIRPSALERFSTERAAAHLVQELRYHAEAPNPMGSFVFWNRTRREIALGPFRLFPDTTRVSCPYLDPTLFDFLSALPARLMLDHELHSETIRRAYPRYRDLPFEDKAAPSVVDRGYSRRYAVELAAYAARRMRSRFIRRAFVLPRLARCSLDGRLQKVTWLHPEMILCLLQLERFVDGLALDREGPLANA